MNRYVALLLLAWVSVIGGCMHHNSPKVTLAIQTKSQTVALVETIEGHVEVGCTGVWVNEDTILTARHCIEGVAELRWLLSIQDLRERVIAMMTHQIPKFEDLGLVEMDVHYIVESEVTNVGQNPEAVHDGKVLAASKEKDLAVIRTVGSHPVHLSAAVVSSVPEAGTDVAIVGHTKGLYYTYMKGTISNVRKSLPDEDEILGPYVQIVAPIWYGNSGGGAFTTSGDLVGIASFMGRAPSQGFFIHPDTIKKFLESSKVTYRVSR